MHYEIKAGDEYKRLPVKFYYDEGFIGHEPDEKPTLLLKWTSYTSSPGSYCQIEDKLYAVFFSNNRTSYAGGGLGDCWIKLYSVEQLKQKNKGFGKGHPYDFWETLEKMEEGTYYPIFKNIEETAFVQTSRSTLVLWDKYTGKKTPEMLEQYKNWLSKR